MPICFFSSANSCSISVKQSLANLCCHFKICLVDLFSRPDQSELLIRTISWTFSFWFRNIVTFANRSVIFPTALQAFCITRISRGQQQRHKWVLQNNNCNLGVKTEEVGILLGNNFMHACHKITTLVCIFVFQLTKE